MKRTSVAALLVLATGLAATAQNRSTTQGSGGTPARSYVSTSSPGTPARGTRSAPRSQSPQRSFVPGPTRVGPNAPAQCAGSGISLLIPSALGCTDTRFTSGSFGGVVGPVNTRSDYFYGGYGYYPGYPVVTDTQPASQGVVVEEPDPPAPTIFEHRANGAPLRPAATDSRSLSLQQSGSPERQQVPTILIFRDGHQTEVLNYAIVGHTLYDVGTFVAHKIPLSDLNLKATIKANEERGIEFSVPSSIKVD